MTARLATAVLVSALIRRAGIAGGTGAVLLKGDPESGALLLLGRERGVETGLLERVLAPDGAYRWTRVGPHDVESAALDDYVARRRRADPDLWLIELDIAGVERLAAEITDSG